MTIVCAVDKFGGQIDLVARFINCSRRSETERARRRLDRINTMVLPLWPIFEAIPAISLWWLAPRSVRGGRLLAD